VVGIFPRSVGEIDVPNFETREIEDLQVDIPCELEKQVTRLRVQAGIGNDPAVNFFL
jgi:hypothetical protein